ncbi:MAG: bifunctional phosphopantothenoylcysteine decarboxylase/phosphopantothenate--cysteine ligase CoaBC [Bryobacterales bacterium]|nr:bifunctional phosphopantothenoylcysteine decarboxylase/phosphopantothenate--cysteine ligase CoaBC [Bryobacteraceae bacterium]MDW8130433.1 bifunctional phosphopantothenoylcysteine decarboxylase/phosphopantothenate--cysteine ligase CoaBC [Bryobacterales bacterium]
MNLVLGVGGGIAAYKAAELARVLLERGHSVQVVMTSAAQQFVRPLTFAALTGRKVLTELFPRGSEETLASATEHIRVAQECELLAVAPATANLLARFAHGLADDLLTALYLAFSGPVVLAPAMNTHMWRHAATQRNVETLRQRGHVIVEPEEGPLACGMVGPGRLADPARIVEAIEAAAARRRDLEGECVLVTAGPTQEPLDPVRFISNRSSGKMGYALAEAALARGARVILISGPVQLAPPTGAELVRVQTATQMREAVLERLPEATIVIKAAAVADYYLAEVPRQKRKKSAARWSLELDPTPDILAEVGQLKGDRILVGFAAETENLVEEARRKLLAKNCDMLVANRVEDAFGADDNELTLVLRTGETIQLGRGSKRELADKILDRTLQLRLSLHAAR